MPQVDEAARRARDVARAATHLASEAAALARVFADHGPAVDASTQASEAAVRAARTVFDLERQDATDVERTITAALVSLDAASSAVAATRAAIEAVSHLQSRGGARGSASD